MTPSFVDRGAHPRLPLSPPRDDRTADESPAHYAQRMRAMEATARELLAAAQAERKGEARCGIQSGRPGAAADQGAARRRRHW